MGNKTYTPQPIDTSDVELSQQLIDLGEQIAKNVYDVWSYGRIIQGWTYSPERNKDEKERPCLVFYEELPKSEKNYDHNTTQETPTTDYEIGV